MKVGREKLWHVRSARRPSLLPHTLRCDWIAVISSDSEAVIAISGPSHRETRDGWEQRGGGGGEGGGGLAIIGFVTFD